MGCNADLGLQVSTVMILISFITILISHSSYLEKPNQPGQVKRDALKGQEIAQRIVKEQYRMELPASSKSLLLLS